MSYPYRTMSTTLEELNKKREILKVRLKRLYNKILNAARLTQTEIFLLRYQFDNVDQIMTMFNEVQDELEHLSEDLDANLTERETIEGIYASIVGLGKRMFRGTRLTDTKYSMYYSSCRNCSHEGVRTPLPSVSLPTFNGSCDRWPEYRDTFSVLVHDNPNLPQILKFHHLRNSLEGSAANLLSSIEFSAENYNAAWQLLTKRYDGKHSLVHSHIKSLFEIEHVRAPRASEDFRKLLDTINENLGPLKALGEPVGQWDTLIIHLVTSKLDPRTAREWEESHKSGSPTLENLMAFISATAEELETYASCVKMCQENNIKYEA